MKPYAAALIVVLAACASATRPADEEQVLGPIEKLRAAAAASVKDPARAAEVARLIEQMEREAEEAITARRAHLQKLRALDADSAAPKEHYRKTYDDFDADRAARLGRVLALRDFMAAAATAQEWERIEQASTAALSAFAAEDPAPRRRVE